MQRGFTLIELMVVMALVGLLLSIAVPQYFQSLERGKERVLEHDLSQMRRAIDQYYSDRGAYPDALQDLVDRKYLRSIPINPFTDDADWVIVAPTGAARGAVFDVKDSRADTLARSAEGTGRPSEEASPEKPDAQRD